MNAVIDFILTNLPLILCLLVGVGLLVLEVFIPGFGICGISGLVLLAVGILMTWLHYGVAAGLGVTLIALALFGKFFNHDRIVYVSVTIFTYVAALFDFFKTLPDNLQPTALVEIARKVLPLFDLNLGWVVPAFLGLALGLIIRTAKNR